MPSPERTAALAALLARAGFAPVDPPILQPADIFLDVSGEELRRRLFLTTDPAGEEMCLRPDLTIPTARLHVAAGPPERAARYSYLGPVFRYRADGPSEFPQAGAESFGAIDEPAEDAAMLALAVESLAALGVPRPSIRLGDVGLFAALVEALDLAPAWRRRLLRSLSRGNREAIEALFGRAATESEHPALLGALAGINDAKARAIVQDLLSIAGIAEVGGRSAAEIAERFLEQADLADAGLSGDVRAVISSFLGIAGSPAEVGEQLRKLSLDAGLRLGPVLDEFERRTDLFASAGLDVAGMHAATAFGRNLDYYTGVVFELTDPVRPDAGILAGGGRYDRLLLALGAKEEVPAVGFSLWLDRTAGAAS